MVPSKRDCTLTHSISVAKFFAYLVILCFEKRRPKQKYCCLPKIKNFGSPKIFGSSTGRFICRMIPNSKITNQSLGGKRIATCSVCESYKSARESEADWGIRQIMSHLCEFPSYSYGPCLLFHLEKSIISCILSAT